MLFDESFNKIYYIQQYSLNKKTLLIMIKIIFIWLHNNGNIYMSKSDMPFASCDAWLLV